MVTLVEVYSNGKVRGRAAGLMEASNSVQAFAATLADPSLRLSAIGLAETMMGTAKDLLDEAGAQSKAWEVPHE